jgi:hypothetical protein
MWIKERTIKNVCYPQYPSFCGVASCTGVLNSLLGLSVSQEILHENYGVGAITKLPLTTHSALESLDEMPRQGLGMSNWDLIRLFNAYCLDQGKRPWTSILCGQDFIREMANKESRGKILNWVQEESCQAIIHLPNHYVVLAGLLTVNGEDDLHFIQADSATTKGPISSSSLANLQSLAQGDPRYGLVLFSLSPIPEGLFSEWSEEMLPKESRELERFDRINRS